MTEPATPVRRPSLWVLWSIIAVGVLPLCWLFLHLLLTYWYFYRLNTPGLGLGVVYVLIPGSLLIAIASTSVITFRSLRAGRSWVASLLQGFGATVVLFVFLWMFEIYRTAEGRIDESLKAQPLMPYLTYHLPWR